MSKLPIVLAVVLSTLGLSQTRADMIMDRINDGQTIRLGFANEVPWAYPGENSEPLGFANAFALGVLEQMGYSRDRIEPVVTEWGGLVPGLKANRFDVITGGMYILESRCANINFSDPMGVFGDAFIVASGNPKGIQNYADLKASGGTLVTGAGYNIVEVARAAGISDDNVMTVPGPTEILAAVRAGRADAGGVTYFTAQNLAKESGGEVEVTDPSQMPRDTLNWVGIGFRPGDTEFRAEFNTAMAEYLGSEEMLAAVAEYGYTENNLPGEDVTTEWVCNNR